MLCGFLTLTYACNNRCRWCYASTSDFKSDMMDFNLAKEFLYLMTDLGVTDVGLIGGEAIFHPNIYEIISFAKKLNLKTTLYTNGRALAKKEVTDKLKKSGLDKINFSVQSGKNFAKEHDKQVQVKGAWEETRQGIENSFNAGLKINIQTVLTHPNFEVYKEILNEFGYTRGLFIYYREIPIVSCDKSMLTAKVLSNKDTKEIYKKIYKYAKGKYRTYFFSRMPLCWWNDKDIDEKKIKKSVVAHCHIINGSVFTVDPYGKLLSCSQFTNMPSADLIENRKVISKKEFLEKYNYGTPKLVRDKLTYYPHKKCKSCKYFGKRCTGGCPLVKFKLGPFA